ncbi:glycogen debranching enzyme family protein [Oscillatoria sp. FACHB-1407]|uniref:amylo-alpha-1,6-glucosidase n=1 Tax=Oscillatoria sp. FACHB-1407 TaxID=2692847 RepID=UPI0016842BD6|nr:amylo-alpha-1,6-glucosidase [Oscillatoria sp. FACHB-1407]MBD2461488.1 glycogen debranching enzyme family protein [Oscillatoria sp. FACHB-1407]
MSIQFGRDICGELSAAESREWLVTNGIGGYACGTIAGTLTRRYHGLLVAALNPPLQRTLMLTKLDETAHYNHKVYTLYANRWTEDIVDPQGYHHLEQFALEGLIPVWRFACADALLEKRVWMHPGCNTTYVQYHLRRASQSLSLKLKALVNDRDHHGSTQSQNWQMEVEATERGIRVKGFPNSAPLYLWAHPGKMSIVHDWYYGFELTAEHDRGLDEQEDHLHAATIEAVLEPGQSLTVVASTEPDAQLDGDVALNQRRQYEQTLQHQWRSQPWSTHAPDWIHHLALSADQFVVSRPIPGDRPGLSSSNDKTNSSGGKSILAGYPWFGDWGRHTLISLPGLTLATGRPDVARAILSTYTHYMDQGMLPNSFAELGGTPDYGSVDATLWYFEAIRAYHAATQDDSLVQELFPVLTTIFQHYREGYRYNIHLDPQDGLLYAGEVGAQLTWMDAKISEWVVTPRIGKAIEVNVLWYNAIATLAHLSQRLGKAAEEYQQLAAQTAKGFDRFWNPQTGYCFDVLDGPKGHDTTLRPNQILAVSLPASDSNIPALLTPEQRRSLVDVCAQQLLTSYGLRSLPSDHPDYRGTYYGDQVERDIAYHQGTAWGWLLGEFVRAHWHVYRDRAIAHSFLEPMANHLYAHGIGTLSEIFDGDAPMTPRGAFAQAWTVAEVLQTWMAIERDVA